MSLESKQKFVQVMERIKGLAACVVGGCLLYFAIDNYLRVTNATIGAVIRIPRILEWSYDHLGLNPSVALHALLASLLIIFGLFKFLRGN